MPFWIYKPRWYNVITIAECKFGRNPRVYIFKRCTLTMHWNLFPVTLHTNNVYQWQSTLIGTSILIQKNLTNQTTTKPETQELRNQLFYSYDEGWFPKSSSASLALLGLDLPVVELELFALQNVSVTASMDARPRGNAGCKEREQAEKVCTIHQSLATRH